MRTGRNVSDRCILNQKTVATRGARGEKPFEKKAQNFVMLTLHDNKPSLLQRVTKNETTKVYLWCRLGRK